MSPRLPEFKMIVALCRGGGIGFQGALPWAKIERDLRFFQQMTRSSVFPYNNAVVMGRKTWESIPAQFKPLPFRDNIVISATHEIHTPGVICIKTLSDIHTYATKYEDIWFIGGASIYEQLLTPEVSASIPIDDIYITFVDETYEFDTAFPLMYQYASMEEWESLRYNHIQRAIWCWTDEESIPKYVSFFAEGEISNNVYQITDVDRDFIASITRPADIRAIQERRTPNTVFLRARSATGAFGRVPPCAFGRAPPSPSADGGNNGAVMAQ